MGPRSRVPGMRNALWMAAALLIGLGAAVPAQGPRGGPGGPPRMPPGGPGAGLPPAFMRVNLTKEQQTQVRSLFEQRRANGEALRTELHGVQRELIAAIYVAAPDDANVSELTARLAELQRLALDADVALQLQVAALLTDDQRRQVTDGERRSPGEAPGP